MQSHGFVQGHGHEHGHHAGSGGRRAHRSLREHGNTSASLAAYAGRAGLQSAVLLPRGQITAGKLAQSLDYGALVCEIDGNFDDCMRLIQELGDDPSIYVANSINPFRIEGQKTVAFELMEQCLWQVPDHVVVPGGNMGNSTALGKGFQELLELRLD